MTTKPAKTAASGQRFDPARRYYVQLARAVEHPAGSGRFLSPGADQLELRGDVALLFSDDILSEELIPLPEET